MSKPLRSFKLEERTSVATKRTMNTVHGLGWLSARDYLLKRSKAPKEAC